MSWMRHFKVGRGVALALAALALSFAAVHPLSAQDEPKISAKYQIEKGTRKGWLIVTVEIPAESHIYSVTQEGNPPPTKIKLAESEQFEILDKIRADKKPHVVENDPVFEQRVETYEAGVVNLLLPIEVVAGVDLEAVKFDAKFHGQICSPSGCKPLFDKPLEVEWAGFYDPPADDEVDKKEGDGNSSSGGSSQS